MNANAKMRHCCYCGDELGVLTAAQWYRGDTCGKRECDRYAQDDARAERDEAHEQLDSDMGWL